MNASGVARVYWGCQGQYGAVVEGVGEKRRSRQPHVMIDAAPNKRTDPSSDPRAWATVETYQSRVNHFLHQFPPSPFNFQLKSSQAHPDWALLGVGWLQNVVFTWARSWWEAGISAEVTGWPLPSGYLSPGFEIAGLNLTVPGGGNVAALWRCCQKLAG
ncbi:hypothetical protein B0H17DRAFT_1154147 [Mycena rosella]|uniref:Uncharacterized protein n=1 Tax=Mycena rosella TaxID=1033263 RepID=A0AAD7F706_MYCRO|nr:hypothetical protein B0H17DRAFT_1154147 [Mycena rosella]